MKIVSGVKRQSIHRYSQALVTAACLVLVAGSCSSSDKEEERPKLDAQAPAFDGLESATAVSSSEIELTWKGATDDRTSSDSITYEVCRSTSAGSCETNFEATFVSDAGATSYRVTGLAASTKYFFIVRAIDAAGNRDGNTAEKSASTSPASLTACNGQPFECCVTEAKDCMIAVPGGTFVRGSITGEGNANETPRRLVTLSAYYLDKYEVTNSNFKKCVDAGKCAAPLSTQSNSRTAYFGAAAYDDYPVIYVNWEQAVAYCTWKGRRFPTEAEWEKAARGPADGSLVGLAEGQCTAADAAGSGKSSNCNLRPYPWGGTITTSVPNATGADCTKLNYDKYYENENVSSQCVGDTSVVGSYASGASPYGVLDMAGNVFEWVNDYYSADYYKSAPATDPQGPSTGSNRMYRGGGYSTGSGYARTTFREDRATPFLTTKNLGFRCAKTP